MVVQLTTRKSIRWLPNEASEPTSTLVLNVGDYFVHLRVNKADETIDWGMAGTRAILATQPFTFQWTKEICSMGTEDTDDVAVFELLPNGDAFETGTMPNPANDMQDQQFEEVWGPLPLQPSDQPAWVLRKKDDKAVTYLARVSNQYLALRKNHDGAFSALRQEIEDGSWKTRYAIGGHELPFLETLDSRTLDATTWSVEDDVTIGEQSYAVMAVEGF